MTTPNLLTRDDTLLGICEGLGEELGFHANYLRVALGASLLWNAEVIVVGYLAVGMVLAVTRWLWPRRSVATEPVVVAAPAAGNDEGVAFARAA